MVVSALCCLQPPMLVIEQAPTGTGQSNKGSDSFKLSLYTEGIRVKGSGRVPLGSAKAVIPTEDRKMVWFYVCFISTNGGALGFCLEL